MGREVRRVPADWQHPKKPNSDQFVALHDGRGFAEKVSEWREQEAKWREGLRDDYRGGWKVVEDEHRGKTFAEWNGRCPDAADHMPEWPEERRTHYQMYETTSEGTPISPVMASPEELARWLADNNASAFAHMGATYEQWLNMIVGHGRSVSAVYAGGKMMSGVAAQMPDED